MKCCIILLFLAFALQASAQPMPSKDIFDVKVRNEVGDINGDGLLDKVMVMMDTLSSTSPLRLQVYFQLPTKKFKLLASSTTLLEAQYPTSKKGKHNGHQIATFQIENRTLIMRSDTDLGPAYHHFRYQNGNLELIYFYRIHYDGKDTTTETDFNLITGIKTQKSKLLTSDVEFDKKIVKLKPISTLPRIQDFVPFQSDLY